VTEGSSPRDDLLRAVHVSFATGAMPAATWHVQNGTPLFALQELGGWESPEMVRRYAHLAADHLAPYAERLGVPPLKTAAQIRHRADSGKAVAISQKRVGLGAVEWSRTTDLLITNQLFMVMGALASATEATRQHRSVSRRTWRSR
jgi:hypothetical protein